MHSLHYHITLAAIAVLSLISQRKQILGLNTIGVNLIYLYIDAIRRMVFLLLLHNIFGRVITISLVGGSASITKQ